MTWNYRILAFEYFDEVMLKICEVYYDKKGNPNGYIEDKGCSSTEGIKGLKWTLKKYNEALLKPILYGDKKFPNQYKNPNK
jgi:hypothetical protein